MMRAPMIWRAGVAALLALAGAAQAERWAKVDFDADLRTMLVNLDDIHRANGRAWLWELEVEGRTAPTRGDEFHVLIRRDYDCATNTETVTAVQIYPDLKSGPENLPFPVAHFVPAAGSINALEMGIACHGNAPPAGTNIYGSVAGAVTNAFADAVKLPASQSNRTIHGFSGMMPPK